jgi:hypothetical protein
MLKRSLPFLCFLLFSFVLSNAQIEGAYASTKKFNAFGVGGFLNFSLPVADANYITIDVGYQYFKNKSDEMDLVPLLLGYRYTWDQSGSGWYVEPNIGFTFDVVPMYGNDPEGVSAGIGIGYLVDLDNVPFNFSGRFEHLFGNPAASIFSIRIAHSLSLRFRNREDY